MRPARFGIVGIAALIWVTQPTIAQAATGSGRAGYGLPVIALLIAINAFFVTAEFAMVSVRRSQIDRLVEDGDRPARTVQLLKRNTDLLLSSTQLGITLSSLALGWMGEQTMAQLVRSWLDYLPPMIAPNPAIAHTISIPVAFALVAYLQIVLGELCPKSLALLYPEQLARFFGPPSLAIARCFRPFLWIINQSTRSLLGLFGIRVSTLMAQNRVTSEELQQIIAKDGEVKGLEAEEREWLSNIFEFGDVTVEEIMTPRTQVCVVDSDATIADVLAEIAESYHSCYPVIGESFDDVRGIICIKDLAEPLIAADDRRHLPIANWVTPVRFVPEYTPLVELVPLLQRSPTTVVMVVDEFGGTAGLVTLQDAIEEIFGDSLDADSSEEPNVEVIDDRHFSVSAQLHVEEANDLLDLHLPISEDYQTIAGLLIFYMQKIPAVGETFRIHDLELLVQSADGPRLERIYIRQLETDLPLLPIAGTETPAEDRTDTTPPATAATSAATSVTLTSSELLAELTDAIAFPSQQPANPPETDAMSSAPEQPSASIAHSPDNQHSTAPDPNASERDAPFDDVPPTRHGDDSA